MERVIRVEGIGRTSVAPDYVEINIIIEGADKAYERACSIVEQRISALQKAVAGIDLGKERLKTDSFNIAPEYENIRDNNGVFRQIFKGFLCTHNLRLGFMFDSKLLGKVFSAIVSSGEQKLSVRFSLRDKDMLKTKLLEYAAADARRSAEALAAASGVVLGDLKSIEYGKNESFQSPVVMRSAFSDTVRFESGTDITPIDIRAEEKVIFTWSIE